MANLNRIGLDKTVAADLVEQLNDLLANYSIFYQNVRGYHWNVRGEQFFELHAKFEELYTDLQLKIDEVAERILVLGHAPQHRYSAYVEVASIKESSETRDGKKAVEDILSAFRTLLAKQREIQQTASETGDEGTNAQMSDYIRAQEKTVWMYSAYLNK